MSNRKTLSQEEVRTLSETLFGARTSAKILDVYPGSSPATLEQAYEVQDLSIAASTDEIVGWKIGMVVPELREEMGAERIMGPVFKNVYHNIGRAHEEGESLKWPVYKGGFIAVEAELVIEIAEDIAPGSVNTADGVEHLVKAVYAGIEIASSPVVDLNDYGPTAIITDFGNNHGMIVGAAIEDWQSKISNMETKVIINDEVINTAPTDGVLNGPMAAFAYVIDQAAARNITLPAGCKICSGAITGVHETIVGSTSTADFGDAGKINLELVAI